MRLAITAQLDANRDAIAAVLADAARRGAGYVLCLGEIGEPRVLVAAVMQQARRSAERNRDLMTVGALPAGLGPLGRRPPAWADAIDAAADASFLRALPASLARAAQMVSLDADPDAARPLRSDEHYRAAAVRIRTRHPETRIALDGSQDEPSHVVVSDDGRVQRFRDRSARPTALAAGITFAGPGRLTPFDDPRACYLTFDCGSATIAFHRVAFRAPAAPSLELDAALSRTLRVADRLQAWLSGTPQPA